MTGTLYLRRMSRTLSFWVGAALLALCKGQNSSYEGESLSESGYHLCLHNETRTVSSLVTHEVPYNVTKPCGGWLLWRSCTFTLYRMTHQTVYKTVVEHVTRCCTGYVQVGPYCALPVNRSRDFAAKPGSCPTADGLEPEAEACVWDIDCPGWKKCCQGWGGTFCMDPTGSRSSFQSGRHRLNATVTVDTGHQEMMSKDDGLLSHTRLLQAMVTGALQSDDVSVLYVSSWAVHPYRTATSLLVDFSVTLPLHDATSRLHALVRRIPEVSAITVEDVDECTEPAHHQCSPLADCHNTEGSYKCSCHQGYTDGDPSNPGTCCTAPPVITSIRSANVTGNSFSIYWSGPIQTNQTYLVVLSKGTELVRLWETTQTMMEVRGLQPGALYNITVTPRACTSHGPAPYLLVRTDAKTVDATVRLANVQFSADLQNASSQAYKTISENITKEMYRSLSAEVEAMVDAGRARVQIRSFLPGSVVAKFSVIVASGQSQDIGVVSSALLQSLMNSSIYTVDTTGTSTDDFDECASGENDCSQWATCTNAWGSYTCTCLDGYKDDNSERPGRACRDVALETSTAPGSSASIATTSGVRANGTSAAPTATITTLSTGASAEPPMLGPVSVRCRVAAITVAVDRGFLLSNGIRDSALYLGLQECGVNGGNATHAELTVAWDECGTRLVHNATYYTASVTLVSSTDSSLSPSGTEEAPTTRLEVPIVCAYKKSMLMSSDFGSMGYDTIREIVAGSGSLQATMELLNGTVPLSHNYSLSRQQEVVLEISVNTSSDHVKVIVNKCWATSGPNPADAYSYTFLENSCSLNAYTKVLTSGKSSKSRVSVEIFSLVSLDVVYLHCQVHICVQTGSDACATDCLQNVARSSNTIGTAKSSFGPLQRSEDQSWEQTYDTVHVVGLSCLGVGLALVFIVGFVCLVYCHRNRIGHYNFSVKTKQENFSIKTKQENFTVLDLSA